MLIVESRGGHCIIISIFLFEIFYNKMLEKVDVEYRHPQMFNIDLLTDKKGLEWKYTPQYYSHWNTLGMQSICLSSWDKNLCI